MGVKRIGRLIRAALLLWAAGLFAILLWTLLWPLDRPLPEGDAIICLGAGVDSAGRIDQASTKRAEACAELARAGAAPIVVFSGGPRRAGLPTAAAGMAAVANAAGMGGALVLLEDASYSTLHNALYSLEMVAPTARLILVTEAFHLPRSWASFKMMGCPRSSSFASLLSGSLTPNSPCSRTSSLRTMSLRSPTKEAADLPICSTPSAG